ncbi:MAG TPA: 2-succinyl-5-enolpyruvyl-6-hydroxy-3-cyclohexene-1-carboxylic-acid synthase [Acidimicrobiales bacterium]
MSVQATFTATLVDEWKVGGVTDAVICPGSRSTPLALALAARLNVHVRLDERSAAFFALGLAMATGRPVIICTTSGTAAAEVHAAVVEAHHAGVPLIVCTADRPPELQQVGASQTIDQIGLFTTATRWAKAPGVPDDSQRDTWRPLAARALAESLHGPRGPGPVHLNLAFREPLIGEPDALPERSGPKVIPAGASVPPTVPQLQGLGMIIAGAGATKDPELLVRFAASLGWPLLADPRSGCRVEGTIAAADAIVRAKKEYPDTILLLGASWLSKVLGEYVAAAAAVGSKVIAIDPWQRWVDPSHAVTEFHQTDPDEWMKAALGSATASEPEWLAKWQGYDAAAQGAILETLGDTLSEPLVARTIFEHADATRTTLMVSASMPMRDVEWYAPTSFHPPLVLANRGANGIDGIVSTALGIAASGQRTMVLLGDLSFLHDVSGLVHLADLPCTFVVVDNGGGGIFSFLPQATALETAQFEELFGTPPTADISEVARGFGLKVEEISNTQELASALASLGDGPSLLRVKVPNRSENVALHDAINQAVRLALG